MKTKKLKLFLTFRLKKYTLDYICQAIFMPITFIRGDIRHTALSNIFDLQVLNIKMVTRSVILVIFLLGTGKVKVVPA